MEPDVIAALRSDLQAEAELPPLLSWRDVVQHPVFRAVAAVAVLAAVAALLLARSSTPHPVIVLPTTSASPVAAHAITAATVVVVDVSGKVVHPGLVRLPTGSRVADALAAAGGARRGVSLDSVNLARVLTDGEQIAVGVPTPGVVGAPGGATGGGPVSINNSTAEQLDALPGIGPVLAARIVAWRTAHGAFSSVDGLTDVPGIGPSLLSKLAGQVRL